MMHYWSHATKFLYVCMMYVIYLVTQTGYVFIWPIQCLIHIMYESTTGYEPCEYIWLLSHLSSLFDNWGVKYALKCYQTQIARLMGPTWGPPGSCRPQMGPVLTPWTLLSGKLLKFVKNGLLDTQLKKYTTMLTHGYCLTMPLSC